MEFITNGFKKLMSGRGLLFIVGGVIAGIVLAAATGGIVIPPVAAMLVCGGLGAGLAAILPDGQPAAGAGQQTGGGAMTGGVEQVVHTVANVAQTVGPGLAGAPPRPQGQQGGHHGPG